MAVVGLAGCQTETCPPGVTDSIFCRGFLDASTDGCVEGSTCNPDGDECAVGVMRCLTADGPTCEVTGRLAEGEPCGGGGFTCAADGTCSVCNDGVVCDTGNPCLGGHMDCNTTPPTCIGDTPVDGGPCGVSGVCGGELCSECIPDVVCSTDNPCATGRTSCNADGSTECVATADAPAGVSCGEGLSCDGSGNCSVCTEGTVCDSGNPCTTGRTDCGSGSPVCLPEDDVPPGTGCGAGGVCSGAGECSECIAGVVCDTGNPCEVGNVDCTSGTPVCGAASNLPSGVGCGVGMACDGSGNCSMCVPGQACVTATCQEGLTDCSTGSPVCQATGPAPAGAVCRPAVDACDIEEVCDGSGAACPPDQFSPAGTACIGRGMCDGTGGCTPFCVDGTPCSTGNDCEIGTTDCSTGVPVCVSGGPEAFGTVCRASVAECDAEEVCDGTALTCPPDVAHPAGRTCTGGVCDTVGACVACVNGAPCTTANPCEAGTLDCSSGAPVCQPAGPATAGTMCRPAAGPCDLEERCDGATTACPPDAFDSTTQCRASTQPCDAAEICDGGGINCPMDELASPGTICPTGVCDTVGACVPCTPGVPCSTGRDCDRGQIDCSSGAAVCVSLGAQPAGTVCRASASACDADEVCDGTGLDCPPDGLSPAGTVCRPTVGSCDVPEICTGLDPLCPPDSVSPPGTTCRSAAGACDTPEACDGVSNVCPPDLLTTAGTVCRGAVDVCDQDETCTGTNPACPVDALRSGGTICRMAVDVCDQTEVCTGSDTACPSNLFTALGTVCPAGVCDGSGGCSMCGGICPSRPNATTTCGGTCGYVCIAGFADCNGSAPDGCEINTDVDVANCGACGNGCAAPANANATCAGASCGYACFPGFADCNGSGGDGCEIDTNIDVGNCGMCGNSCPVRANATSSCSAGGCGFSCNGTFRDCNASPTDGCEINSDNDIAHCGACGNVCPTRPNSVPTCGSGTCGFTCNPGWGDCNGNAADGCETNLNTTAAHCGACGSTCPNPANGTGTCSGGICGYSCSAGFADCNMSGADGCEIDLNVDIFNCGGCGTACPGRPNASTTCSSATCGYSCNGTFSDCNASPADGCEINTSSDTNNCGSCGNSCPTRPNSTPSCTGSTCGFTCNPGWADCNGSAADGCETNLDNTLSHCGSCGNSCPNRANSSRTCIAGSCGYTCNGGYDDCDANPANGCEVNLNADLSSCGACGNACPTRPNSSPNCLSGMCGYTCDPGFSDCNGSPSDGCEVFTGTDLNNCGTCGNVCPTRSNSTRTCTAGTCGISCIPNYGDCDGNPTNGCENFLDDDELNCGTCGNICPTRPNASRFCAGGACDYNCSPGYGDCNGIAPDGCEVNLQTSVSNCGACGFTCNLPNAGEACSTGVCTVSSCDPGYYDVDGSSANGCECQDDPTPNICTSADNIGNINIGGSGFRSGKVVPSLGEDWFRVSFPLQTATFGGGTPTIGFSANPGNVFRFDIVGTGCGGTNPWCGGATGLTSWSITDNVSDTAQGFRTRNNAWPTTVWIRVYRVMSGPSCLDYGLAVSRP